VEVERTRKMTPVTGPESPYIEENPSTAFATRLIPQYESHIRITKETIQFVVTFTKEIPHSNCVIKEKNTKVISTCILPGDRHGEILLLSYMGESNKGYICFTSNTLYLLK